ncbi:MAG TPA: hypothetical protein VI451_19265 [Anaerolineales bacterium]|nr:hypothetical protein [Anaerolineales bacterium]
MVAIVSGDGVALAASVGDNGFFPIGVEVGFLVAAGACVEVLPLSEGASAVKLQLKPAITIAQTTRKMESLAKDFISTYLR